VAFFAEAVKARSHAAADAISRLLTIKDEFAETLDSLGHRGSVVQLAGELIGYPVLDVPRARDLLGVSYQAANTAVAKLVELGILRQVSTGGYGRVFRCPKVFDVVAGA